VVRFGRGIIHVDTGHGGRKVSGENIGHGLPFFTYRSDLYIVVSTISGKYFLISRHHNMASWKPKIQKTNGICSLCGGVFGKTAIKKHLVQCMQKHSARKPSGFSVPIQTRLFTILVKGSFLHEYWMYLEVPSLVIG